MKFWTGFILIYFPLTALFSKNLCPDNFVEKEKNIKKIYHKMSHFAPNCQISPETYLDFGKRAYLAGEYTLGLWSLQNAMQNLPKKAVHEYTEYYYYLGLTYLARNRFEEAIAIFKKIVFADHYETLDQKFLQKSHMALLQCYHNREKTHDKNVKYLIELFKSRYKSSPYLFAIRSWNTEKYSSN